MIPDGFCQKLVLIQRDWASVSKNALTLIESVVIRQSYKALEDYPGQNEDDDAPHAKAGAAVANKIGELLNHYRTTIPQL